MNIQKAKTMPNGATAISHLVDRVTVANGAATALITSFTDGVGTIGWQEPVDVPLRVFTTGNPLADAARWTITLGAYLDGGTIIDPSVADVEQARAKKKQDISDAWKVAENAGYQTSFGFAQSDQDSRDRLTPTVLLALMSIINVKPFATTWKMANNTTVAMDATKMCQFGAEMAAVNGGLFNKAQALKAAVAAATTIVGIDAIAW